jgi:hypothetical protein
MTDDPGSHLDALCAAHEQKKQPDATFRALDAAASASVGHILFAVLVHHPVLRRSERRYTNQPVAYPVGGHKPVTDTPWMDQVIRRGEPLYRPHPRGYRSRILRPGADCLAWLRERAECSRTLARGDAGDNEPTAPGRVVRRVACANAPPQADLRLFVTP